PFWLNPVKHYVGPAWYQRHVTIPSEWKGRRVVLFLERAHWRTRVWLDDAEIGTCDSLSVPHVYELGAGAGPGRHRLTIRVDNRLLDVDVGANAHSVSDHTQSNWNGLAGRIELRAGSPLFIEDVRVYPDPAGRRVRAIVMIGNATGRPQTGNIILSARLLNTANAQEGTPFYTRFSAPPGRTEIELAYPLGPDAPLWDEFAPNVFELTAGLGGLLPGLEDKQAVRFGLRDFRALGTRFAVNGRPVFLRGTLECCIFPLTGYPATSVDEWKRIYGVLKAHGLNHMRFHSWCPPEAAFAAADEMGIYLYIECAAWTTVGDGKPIDAWIYRESERIVQAYGNHPSFCLMSYGNEPGGKAADKYLTDFVSYWKNKDGRRLYTGAAGWPQLPESDFQVTPEPRIQHWGEGLNSILNRQAPQTLFDFRETIGKFDKPVIGHEIGQWCVYPNFKEIAKYTGVLKAKNFEIFRDTLGAAGMGSLSADFLSASGKLQSLCYKSDIEAA
ncbi:MAG: glycoside hydrolase family 2 TIM barrel-domain containing protein, partial [Candidatus Aminicenantales bacterium]